MARIVKVIGPAGTGKTTYILQQMLALESEGIPFEQIGFFSFSRQALAAMATKIGQIEMPPWFRTFHSLGAYLRMSSRGKVISLDDWVPVLRRIHVTTPAVRYDTLIRLVDGAVNYAANAGVTFSKALEQCDLKGIPLADCYRLEQAMKEYRESTGKVAFCDMLDVRDYELPNLKAVFFDESQDLSYAQVQIVNRFLNFVDKAWVVGDPNQVIYGWAGNSETWLLNLKAHETIVLPRSYRLPKAVLRFSQAIIERVGSTYDFLPKEEDGEVNVIEDISSLPFKNGESWMILVRNNYQIGRITNYLKEKNIQPYPLGKRGEMKRHKDLKTLEGLWAYTEMLSTPQFQDEECTRHVIQYTLGPEAFRNCRAGVPLESGCGLSLNELTRLQQIQASGADRISIGTFHSSKGLEADNVVIFTECTVKQKIAWNQAERSEVCPYYVAATRAAKRLYLVPAKKGLPHVI